MLQQGGNLLPSPPTSKNTGNSRYAAQAKTRDTSWGS